MYKNLILMINNLNARTKTIKAKTIKLLEELIVLDTVILINMAPKNNVWRKK